MTRLLYTITMVVVLLTSAKGQSLTPWVIGSSGGYADNQGNSLSWTLGELETATRYNNGNFLTQGFQQPWNFFQVDTQEIVLLAGWYINSTYIIPNNPSVPVVFSDVVQNLLLMKDEAGLVYWPAFNLDLIGSMQIGKAYKVNMSNTDTLYVVGSAVVPENTTFFIPQGWSLLGYLRQTPAVVSEVLSSITSSIKLVKNSSGQVYWPMFGLNQIGNMNPGQGYQINTSAATPFSYPANTQNFTKTTVNHAECVHYPVVKHSESNLTLGIPANAWDKPPSEGDEIAVYSNSGILAGSAVFVNDLHTMPVWGDDSYTDFREGPMEGEAFFLTLWHRNTNTEEIIQIEEWIEGSDKYQANDICIAGSVKHTGLSSGMKHNLQCSNYPNPFAEFTTFEFFVPEASNIRIELFNLFGESIEQIIDRPFEAGTHQVEYTNPGLASGTYICKVSSGDNSLTNYISVLK